MNKPADSSSRLRPTFAIRANPSEEQVRIALRLVPHFVLRRVACLLTAVLILAGVSHAQDEDQRVSEKKMMQVLQFAFQMADEGVSEISFEAVRKSLGAGPPYPLRSERDDLKSATEMLMQIDNSVYQKLALLVNKWREQQTDSKGIYQTLKSVVFPGAQGSRIHLYQYHEPAPKESMAEKSVGRLLIEAALLANETQDLVNTLRSFKDAANSPDARWSARVLHLELAMRCESSPTNPLPESASLRSVVSELVLESRDESSFARCSPFVHDSLLLRLRTLQQFPEHQEAASQLLRKAILATSGAESLQGASASRLSFILCLSETHRAFLRGDIDEALRMVQVADKLALSVSAGMSQTTRNALLQDHDRTIARWLLLFGQKDPAIARVRKCVERDLQATPQAAGTPSAAGILWQELQVLPADARFGILLEGAFLPGSQQLRIPAFARLLEELPPAAILKSLPDPVQSYLTHTSSFEYRRLMGNSFSALLSAAAECGRMGDVESRLNSESQTDNGQAANSPARTMAQIAILLRLRRDAEARQLLKTLPPMQVLCRSELDGWMLVVMLQEMALRDEFVPDVQQWLAQRTDGADSRLQTLIGEIQLRILPDRNPKEASTSPSRALLIAGSNRIAAPLSAVVTPATWVSFDGITSHLTGTGNDQLYFPYPLSGEFTISGLALSGPGGESDLGFDGLCFESTASGILNVSSLRNHSRSLRSISFHDTGIWDRKALMVSNDSMRHYDNGHLIWTGARPTQTTPWFFLSSSCGRRSYWQDLQISGQVSIPKEVSLAGGASLRGWSCNLFEQKRSDALLTTGPNENVDLSKSHDWSCRDGLIIGRRKASPDVIVAQADISAQGLLQYDRPLVSGETLTWEFEYLPDQVLAHPCLGRTAILLTERTAALHWLPVSPEDRTLFPVDQAVEIFRSNEQPLLTPGWNTGRIEITETQIEVFINNQQILVLPAGTSASNVLQEIPVCSQPGIQFGVYHNVHKTAAHVRNIVLKGPWPESITPKEFASIMNGSQLIANPATEEISAWLQTSCGDSPFELGVDRFLDSVQSLSDSERFRAVKSWAMPDRVSPSWRLFGSPGMRANRVVPEAEVVDVFHGQRPGIPALSAPVLMMLDLASQTGQMESLRSEIHTLAHPDPANAIVPNDNQTGEAEVLAAKIVLTLIDLRTKADDGRKGLLEIADLIKGRPDLVSHSNHFGLLMLADQADSEPDCAAGVLQILQVLSSKESPSLAYAERRKALADLTASLRSLLLVRDDVSKNGQSVRPLQQWKPFRSLRASQHAAGQPESLWVERSDQSLQHVMGTECDVIRWPIPLRGDLEVTCQLHAAEGQFPAIGFGGVFYEPRSQTQDVRRFLMGRGDDERSKPVDAVIGENSCQVSLVVAGQMMKLSVDGKEVLTEPINSEQGSWLCFRAAKNPGAGISDIQLNGATPARVVSLDTNGLLPGWSAPWFSEDDVFPKGNPSSMDWRSSQGQLVGVRRATLANTGNRSLLRYFHPLLEDGEISWRFFYAAKDRNVFPVLGDTAFLVEASRQPSVHRVKGSRWETAESDFDSTGRTPADVILGEPELIENQWNHADLQIIGDRAILKVNDKAVMEKVLSDDNDRTFGFLHWNGDFEAAVQDVDWVPAP
ncbi:MAG: DUF1583 domain-containing protein [Planctomycetaceae bacterium]